MTCEGCKWWDDFSWVCCNSDSKYCADFVNEGCMYYESGKRERDRGVDSSGGKSTHITKGADA